MNPPSETDQPFHALFWGAPLPIYIHDAESGQILDCNPAAWHSYGCETREEFESIDMWLDPPYSRDDAIVWMRKVLDEGLQCYEWCSRKRDGELFWEELRLLRMHIGGQDRVVLFASDITARKRAEQALLESESKLRAVTEQSPLGIALMSPQRKILYANGTLRKWFPSVDFSSGPRCYCSIHQPPLPEASCECPVARTLREGEVFEGNRSTTINGSLRHLHLISSPVRDEQGRIIAAMELLEDVTERQSYERELEAAAEENRLSREREAALAGRMEMAGGLLHDIGNAITGLLGSFTDLQEDARWPEIEHVQRIGQLLRTQELRLDELLGSGKGAALCQLLEGLVLQLRERADRHQKAVDRSQELLRHVSDILTLQRRYALEGRKGEQLDFRMEDLLNHVLQMLSVAIEKRKIHILKPQASPNREPILRGDRTAIMQVLLNLLKNACEAFDQDTLPKQGVISFETQVHDGTYQLTIRDNACGFTSAQLAQVFQPGYTPRPTAAGSEFPLPAAPSKPWAAICRCPARAPAREPTCAFPSPSPPCPPETPLCFTPPTAAC